MSDREEQQSDTPKQVAIESRLPLTAIDIESQKDMQSGRYPALRGLHKWFAGRPTPAARLSIIASAYPDSIDPDTLLRLMQCGPKELDTGLSDYIIEKFSQDRKGSTIDDHYGYPNPNTQSPTAAELSELHETVRDAWGGELPTVLDPTAGRGIIPFESMRYGFSTVANELNPIPSVLLNVALRFAPSIGSLEAEVSEWGERILETARKNTATYFPTQEGESQILSYACTYLISCEACGGDIPLTSKWWINQSASGGVAAKPRYEDGEVEYGFVEISSSGGEFNPQDAPVDRGNADCPHCSTVNEEEDIRDQIQADEFEYSVYGVNYESTTGNRQYRAGTAADEAGLEQAAERIETDFELLDYLAEPIKPGLNTTQIKNYGMDEWRDIFTPRQLVTHFEFYKAYEEHKTAIQEKYDDETANAILTILTLGSSRAFGFNSRLSQWYDSRGYPDPLFTDNNYAMKKMFGENNLAAPRRGYKQSLEHVLDSYEELTTHDVPGDVELLSQDAATLSDSIGAEEVDIAVVDPPYYSSIMYAELSEGYYVIQKPYLEDVFPELFNTRLPNRDDEAVANPSRFNDITDDETSKKQRANEYYEQKMQAIFSELNTVMNSDGVMTVMFTHREMDAWDTLTSALIDAGFAISATHPIKTEKTDRVGLQGKSSADSSILLVARKVEGMNTQTTLWETIADDIQEIAKAETEEILKSGYNISKTDMAIAAYGPTLHRFTREYPIVDKKGEIVRPRKALAEARKAVTSVIAETFLNTSGIERLDALTRWYILCWLVYDNDTMPYDEGRQLGMAADVDIDNIKRATKIWRGGQEVTLQSQNDRVQDIVMVKDSSTENPSSRKYPVDPTDSRFAYTIDTVHVALHVYEREGPRAAWKWLSDRNLKSNDEFKIAVAALLEVLPSDTKMHELLVNLVSGETGEYLEVNLGHLNMAGTNRQSELGEHIE